ncbi:MAG: hybrid sensor histidine kinase/response regulator [Oscillatoriales cyanobacterium]|jgi:signal transduction histidine kinase|uniref:histidine kinase n=1 Tax=Microcoleus anatoxicus PTRS2 TaxID=2705321 RepID=A0ABU8YJF4_9CYAN|nr:MAG: hybrid sensor histidine kinase/response regulator [Oscillatoriales cyanobacterium]TAD98311.1 MAG: hybrid sensor histidine kinase/response regulator [Oscillatoriales cyanobacterium]TAE05549.1 MAG: hybrid sensor histidine kinase/response regulator [Oscillatoriales cyanobacterium]TAF02702.1 MAG: hybrid sensor histidine kinase/response regulator [Oscillatoriales cyanobacterium]TAF44413.1 MAG: hybrid sensor histidine kinase/response regulator [Oscillatoriales cyanobacterium]
MNDKNSERSIILIVDDNQTNLDVLFELLRNYGFKVLVAQDGESAIEQIEYIHPDLILLDIMMPGIDGFETCRRLKADPPTQDIPIIFMSALSDTLDKVKGFQTGAVDYITKPFQHEEVLSRIETHLTIRSLQKKLEEKNAELAHLNQNLERLVEQKSKQLIDQEKTAIIGRLTQGMVHNLKSPLQVMQTSVDLIETKATKINDYSFFSYTKYILQAITKVNQIMDTLMVKSRKEQEQDLQPVNINELVQREIQLLEGNLYFKNKIKKKYFYDDKMPNIPLIYSYISQVFYNLINNAMDAMWDKKSRELTIVTRQDESKIYLEIADTGCGIAPEDFSKIFDPFYTSKPAKGEEQKEGEPTGTGLGLYTCIELLKPFKGEIAISSNLGKGSIFTVVLPKRQ